MTRQTPCGPIAGVPARTPGVTAYKGIRYATAGRWQYPVPVTRWDGCYRADHFGPNAMQQSAFARSSVTSSTWSMTRMILMKAS